MSSRASKRVAVLMGGPSAEREVSLVSGRECAAALREAGYEVYEIDAGQELTAASSLALVNRLVEIAPDVVFNALHGRWGEDGAVQGPLEWMGMPYTHSGVLSSAVAMNKERAKEAYRAAGLPVARSVVFHKDDLVKGHPIDPPYVIKPFDEGSSVGIYIVEEGANQPPEIADDMPAELMAERFVPGRELTVAVMGDRPLAVTDIIANSGWYDYEAKYAAGGSTHIIPADVPDYIEEACLDLALKSHIALGCRGLSRTDFRWDDRLGADGLAILETNTQPGMTPTSLAPEQAAYVGISFPELVSWLVEDASCQR